MGKDTKYITRSSNVIQRRGLDTAKWKEERDEDEDMKLVKPWLNHVNRPSIVDLKMRSTTIQRLAKFLESLVVDPQSNSNQNKRLRTSRNGSC